jgi:8-oxo-dGTP pyrophosphatase MutT (NUDIX family)
MSSRYAVILIKNPENPQEYLMGRRRDNGKINFPAGGINHGEEPIVGASRETREETGFQAKNLKLVDVNYKKDDNNKPIIVYTYLAEIDGNPTLEKDPDMEFQSLFWMNPFRVPSSELHIKPDENSGLKALVKILKGNA